MKNIYQKALLFLAGIGVSFFLERLFGAVFGGYGFVPPLVLFTAAGGLPLFSLSWRLWLAGGIGFLMDIFGGQTFGVSVFVLLIGALLVEIFHSLISAREWGVGRASVAVALAVCLLVLFPVAEKGIAALARLFS
ncbi:MAG: hypothetical protein Greene071436_134 [Parcubacteria group bacterium Greene0714_36]|nr:MAG: hypothetical protein Greene071436_134 [Parcubacteria group bacterium Greene0714_36]